MTTTLETDIQTELAAIADRCGCELIHIDFAGGILKLVLDSPNGITLEHCEKVSRDASAMLDVCEFGSGKYTLEVSSPGLDRELYGDGDYERFSGETISVTWRDPETSLKRTDDGTLVAYSAGDHPSIELQAGDDLLKIRLADIQKAHLDPQF